MYLTPDFIWKGKKSSYNEVKSLALGVLEDVFDLKHSAIQTNTCFVEFFSVL